MDLVTACPYCNTRLRVRPEQLGVRRGQVRCGRCANVFDGRAHLVRGSMPPRTELPPLDKTSAGPEATRAPEPALAQRVPGGDSLPAQGDRAAAKPAAEPAARPAQPGAAEPAPAPEPAPVPFSGQVTTGQAWHRTQLALVALLLAGLAAQSVFLFRSELAIAYPALKPSLQRACEWLHCTLRLPRRADLLSIEASDLHPDPARPEVLVLSAIVRNRAGFPQGYPSLALTLTDTRDQPVVRRTIPPAAYLPGTASAETGLAADSEISIQLAFESTNLKASGYRLLLYHP